MLQYWALVVAINKYFNDVVHEVMGADLDGERVVEYLKQDLKTPADHICYLQDAEAKRSTIISEFRRHLIDNPRIRKGDAIIFHYSGHGSRMKAPPGWTVVEEKTRDGWDDMIETIVPFDDGAIDPTTGRQICSIPDRTLAALIDCASRAHGTNITIILDCCHSGHGTRGNTTIFHDGKELAVRSVHPSLLSPLDPEVDRDLMVESLSSMRTCAVDTGTRAGAFRASLEHAVREPESRARSVLGNHVLLAACGPREVAAGAESVGGIFTGLWLIALRNQNIRPRTYTEIIKFINMAAGISGYKQHPQCDGIVRDRLVFQEVVMSSEYFDTAKVPGSANTLQVSAGEVHGIGLGTQFEIHLLGEDLGSAGMLGKAEVKRIEAVTSLLDVHWKLPPTGKMIAVVSQGPEKLRYTIDSNVLRSRRPSAESPEDRQAQESIERFRRGLKQDAGESSLGSITEVQKGEESELRLSFEGNGSMTIYRSDPLLSTLLNKTPRLTPEEVKRARFFSILKGIARFNRLLTLASATHPFNTSVTFDMYHLVTKGDRAEGFVISESETPVKISGEEVVVEEDGRYAIVLHNHSSKSLYVQIWYFDPNTYGICPFYQPAEPNKANLAARGGRLQIGASTEMAEPLQFYLPQGSQCDSAFVKIFVTDKPAKLDSLNQDDLIGLGPDGKSNVLRRHRRGGESEIQTTGHWDTILRRISVERKK